MRILCFFLLSGFFMADSLVEMSPLDLSSWPKINFEAGLFLRSENKPVTKKDFVLHENDTHIKDFTLTQIQGPLNIGLVLDISGSIKPFIEHIQAGALEFISTMTDQDSAMITCFANKAMVVHEMSQDRESLKNMIKKIRPGGGTKLYDGLYLALESISDGGALVLFTDGKDQFTPEDAKRYSNHSVEEVIALSRNRNIPIHVISVGEEVDEKILSTLANWSGGSYFPTLDPSQVKAFYQKIATVLSRRYRIEYESVYREPNGQVRTVTLSETTGETSAHRKYVIGEPDESTRSLLSFGDWKQKNAVLQAGDIDLNAAMGVRYSAFSNTVIREPKIAVDAGRVDFVEPTTTVDLSDPFNPVIKVDPGKLTIHRPVIEVDPGSVTHETGFELNTEGYMDGNVGEKD